MKKYIIVCLACRPGEDIDRVALDSRYPDSVIPQNLELEVALSDES